MRPRITAGLAQAVADVTGHPRANVHVIATPDATGRVAFGGVPVEADQRRDSSKARDA